MAYSNNCTLDLLKTEMLFSVTQIITKSPECRFTSLFPSKDKTQYNMDEHLEVDGGVTSATSAKSCLHQWHTVGRATGAVVRGAEWQGWCVGVM